MYIIRNGVIVAPTTLLFGYELVVDGDRIASIAAQGTTHATPEMGVIDAHGGFVTPGFVDIHSDFVEQVISPRPTVLMDMPTALFEAERELLSHGITTMFHSLSVHGISASSKMPLSRQWPNVTKIMDLISAAKRTEGHNEHLIRHRCHARIEVDSVDIFDELAKRVAAGDCDEISFMDHTPGQGQYRTLENYRNSSSAAKRQVTVEDEKDFERVIEQMKAEPHLTYEQLKVLADLALERGIAIASHDDDTLEKLSLMQSLGCTISEFPVTMEVARAARERGMATVLGTPNILLGKSHAGNLSARDAVQAGVASVLCSDYYPTAMLHSAFRMHHDFGLPLEQAFAMLTINPARAVHVDDELGSLEEGKKADILIVREVQEDERTFPVITCALVGGRVVSRSWYPNLPSASAQLATDAAQAPQAETLVDEEAR